MCGFWSVSSIHAKNAPLWSTTAFGCCVSITSSHAWIPKMIQRSASFWWFWKCIAWTIELFGSDQESIHIKMNIFLMTSSVMGWCVCDDWASCLRFLLFFPASCDSLMELSQSSMSTNYSRFPEACLKCRNSCDPTYFGVLHLVLPRRKLSCEQLFFSIFFDIFCNAFFQRRDWYIMTACVADKLIQSFAIAQVVNEIWWFTFLDYFCFAGIVVETNCTRLRFPWYRKCFVFPFVRVWTPSAPASATE